jgi:hypothetical protein
VGRGFFNRVLRGGRREGVGLVAVGWWDTFLEQKVTKDNEGLFWGGRSREGLFFGAAVGVSFICKSSAKGGVAFEPQEKSGNVA